MAPYGAIYYGAYAIWRHLLPPIESRARRATQLSPVREKYNCSKSEGKKFGPHCGKKWVNVIGRVVYRSALKLYTCFLVAAIINVQLVNVLISNQCYLR